MVKTTFQWIKRLAQTASFSEKKMLDARIFQLVDTKQLYLDYDLGELIYVPVGDIAGYLPDAIALEMRDQMIDAFLSHRADQKKIKKQLELNEKKFQLGELTLEEVNQYKHKTLSTLQKDTDYLDEKAKEIVLQYTPEIKQILKKIS